VDDEWTFLEEVGTDEPEEACFDGTKVLDGKTEWLEEDE